MQSISKINSVSRQYFNPVDAVKLYTDINSRSVNQKSDETKAFIGARQGLGIGAFCFVGEGQLNGQPPTEYTYKNGFCEEVKRTFDMFA